MKKGNGMTEAPSAPSLSEIGMRWRAEAQAEEENVLAQLREQAAEAVAAGQAVLPVYAAVEREHGARLRADQAEFKSEVYARSRWAVDVGTVHQQGAAILETLAINPPAIRKQLEEIGAMTIQYARSFRLRDLCESLVKHGDTGQQLAAKVRDYDDAMARLHERLTAERPDLSPRPTLASAGGDGPPPGPRRAISALSGGDAA